MCPSAFKRADRLPTVFLTALPSPGPGEPQRLSGGRDGAYLSCRSGQEARKSPLGPQRLSGSQEEPTGAAEAVGRTRRFPLGPQRLLGSQEEPPGVIEAVGSPERASPLGPQRLSGGQGGAQIGAHGAAGAVE